MKQLLSDRRSSFTMDNLAAYLILFFNKQECYVSLSFAGGKKPTYLAHFAIDLFSVVGCCCCCFQIIIIINAIFRSYFNAKKVIFSMSYFSITSYLTGSVYKTRKVKITK